FGAVYDGLFAEKYPLVDEALAERASKRDKLLRVYELLVIEPWAVLMSSPMASEFYEACTRVLPEAAARHERQLVRYTEELLGTKDVAEVFSLSVSGLTTDLPTVPILRRRLSLLIDRFVG